MTEIEQLADNDYQRIASDFAHCDNAFIAINLDTGEVFKSQKKDSEDAEWEDDSIITLIDNNALDKRSVTEAVINKLAICALTLYHVHDYAPIQVNAIMAEALNEVYDYGIAQLCDLADDIIEQY